MSKAFEAARKELVRRARQTGIRTEKDIERLIDEGRA